MSKHQWPNELGGNKFTLAKLDPAEQPVRYEVTTWSNVFGEGGSVSVDAIMAAGRRIDLASIEIATSRSVLREREHLQALLDDWQEGAEANWTALVTQARDYVIEYHQSAIAEVSA